VDAFARLAGVSGALLPVSAGQRVIRHIRAFGLGLVSRVRATGVLGAGIVVVAGQRRILRRAVASLKNADVVQRAGVVVVAGLGVLRLVALPRLAVVPAGAEIPVIALGAILDGLVDALASLGVTGIGGADIAVVARRQLGHAFPVLANILDRAQVVIRARSGVVGIDTPLDLVTGVGGAIVTIRARSRRTGLALTRLAGVFDRAGIAIGTGVGIVVGELATRLGIAGVIGAGVVVVANDLLPRPAFGLLVAFLVHRAGVGIVALGDISLNLHNVDAFAVLGVAGVLGALVVIVAILARAFALTSLANIDSAGIAIRAAVLVVDLVLAGASLRVAAVIGAGLAVVASGLGAGGALTILANISLRALVTIIAGDRVGRPHAIFLGVTGVIGAGVLVVALGRVDDVGATGLGIAVVGGARDTIVATGILLAGGALATFAGVHAIAGIAVIADIVVHDVRVDATLLGVTGIGGAVVVVIADDRLAVDTRTFQAVALQGALVTVVTRHDVGLQDLGALAIVAGVHRAGIAVVLAVLDRLAVQTTSDLRSVGAPLVLDAGVGGARIAIRAGVGKRDATLFLVTAVDSAGVVVIAGFRLADALTTGALVRIGAGLAIITLLAVLGTRVVHAVARLGVAGVDGAGFLVIADRFDPLLALATVAGLALGAALAVITGCTIDLHRTVSAVARIRVAGVGSAGIPVIARLGLATLAGTILTELTARALVPIVARSIDGVLGGIAEPFQADRLDTGIGIIGAVRVNLALCALLILDVGAVARLDVTGVSRTLVPIVAVLLGVRA